MANNSLTQPTGGWNVIRVRNGQVVEGQNADCPSCSVSDFASLTIESLFERIDNQCLWGFPSQYCNVAYHPDFGYPVRIDTYPYELDGQERPSVTVEEVIFEELK